MIFMTLTYRCGNESSYFLLEVGHVDPLELAIDFLAELLQVDCIYLDLPQFILDGSEGPHGCLYFLDEALLVGGEVLSDEFELVHLTAVLHRDNLLLLPLLLPNLLLLDLLLLLHLLVLLALDDSNTFVELGEEVGEFGVDLVDQVAEVGARLVVDALEEQNRSEVFLEVLDLLFGQLPLKDVEDVLLLAALHLLRKLDDLVLQRYYPIYIPSQIMNLHRVHLDDLVADDLYFIVRARCYLVDEVAYCQLGALTQNILDVLTLHKLHLLYRLHDAPLCLCRLKLAFPSPPCLLEQQNSLLEHQKVHEQSLFLTEEEPIFVFQLNHFANLLVVVLHCVIYLSPIDNQAAAIFNVLESLEAAVQVPDQFGEFVSPCLTDMALVYDEDEFNFLINIKQALHEEGV